ncbi:MAG: dihydrodipicolinate synthase family protein [Armatimonadaceae bacterium]
MPVSWGGVFPAVTTQMNPDGSLNLDTLAAHLELLIESGVHGLILCGSLGENTALEPEEKRQVVKTAMEVSNGRVPVLSGVAECSTAAACRYARDMEALGADGIMVLPAMVYRSDSRETLAHFQSVAAATGLPIMVYNNPVSYGVDITPEMFKELAEIENIVAIKESSAITSRFIDIQNAVGDRFALFAGVDPLILECVLLGAVGWVTGLGQSFPTENQRMWEYATRGEWEKAKAIYRWYMPLLYLDLGPHFVQKIKLANQENGIGAEWVRPPRLPLTDSERAEVLTIIHYALETRPV